MRGSDELLNIEIDVVELNKQLENKKKVYTDAFYGMLKDNIINAYVEIRNNSPIDTGYMQSSVYYTLEKTGGQLGVGAEYAVYVEYGGGTPRKAGTIPFFNPAIGELLSNIERDLNNLENKKNWKQAIKSLFGRR